MLFLLASVGNVDPRWQGDAVADGAYGGSQRGRPHLDSPDKGGRQ